MFTDIDEVRAAVDRYGWYVPCVLPDVPAGVTWAYTVGMTEAGLPELIVFGEWPEHAHAILSRTREQLLRSPSRARAGEPLGVVHTRFGDCETRLGAVSQRWLDRFPLWASELYGPDVRVRQVVLSHRPDVDLAPARTSTATKPSRPNAWTRRPLGSSSHRSSPTT